MFCFLVEYGDLQMRRMWETVCKGRQSCTAQKKAQSLSMYRLSSSLLIRSTEHTLESHRYYRIINREEVKRGRANLLNPDRQRKDESQRQITQQKTTELPLLVNRKCGNSTQRPTDIEFNFKIWKSGICLTSYKVCVASFPQ